MKLLSAATSILLLATVPAIAQQMQHQQAGMPAETGQSAFAAIQEIVSQLESDPATDWSKVNIEALRQHLIDMDNVTLRARVKTEENDDSIRFTVTGDGTVPDSIRRMVLAHAAMMNGQGGWLYRAAPIPDGAILTVTPSDPAQLLKLRGLGFIGIMAEGMHHQMHHMMLARGLNPH
jgi:hypothetical protein